MQNFVSGLIVQPFKPLSIAAKMPLLCLPSSKIMTLHPLTARRVCGGRTHSLGGGEGGGGSIFWKTQDTALYPTYVSTLWLELTSALGWDDPSCACC
jgi:hypothetical protein